MSNEVSLDDFVIQAARQNLAVFSMLVDPKYTPEKFHRFIASQMGKLFIREKTRLILEVPPQHGKSTLASENFPAWALGRDPSLNVIVATYAFNYAKKLARRTRRIIASPIFSTIFPEFAYGHDKNGKGEIHDFVTTAGGGYYAAGIDGGITGRPCDIAIVDDPYKNSIQADSKNYADKVKDWYRESLVARLHEKSVIVLILTRWRRNDMAGWFLDEHSHEDWEELKIKAIADEDDVLGRSPGEELWPERFPLTTLLKKKKTMGSRKFEALYQQSPTVAEGSIFKREWWQTYNPDALPPSHTILISWDTASSVTEQAAQTAGTVWAINERGAYLLAHIADKFEYAALKKKVMTVHRKYQEKYKSSQTVSLIEKKSTGIALLSDLQDEPDIVLSEYDPTGDGSKELRAEAVTPLIEAGKIYVPDSTKPGFAWAGEFVDELAEYPNGTYKDTADSVSQALKRFNERYISMDDDYSYESVSDFEDDDDEW